MGQTDSSALMTDETRGPAPRGGGPGGEPGRPGARTPRRGEGGLIKQYKPDQGKTTRTGTLIALLALIAWGAKFLFDRLQLYQGDEAWRLLITHGIPILNAVILGSVSWWFVYAHRATSDFLIATEGEMKKVSWSSRSEVIGSTKVVIMFTILLALFLFLVDFFFQQVFSSIGVLKK